MIDKLLELLNEYPKNHRLIEHNYDLTVFKYYNSTWLLF